MKKLHLMLFFLVMSMGFSFAQQNLGSITGEIVSRGTREAITDAKIILHTDPLQTVKSGKDGSFFFESVPYGVYRLTIEARDFQTLEMSVRISSSINKMNYISLVPDVVMDNIDSDVFADLDTENSFDDQTSPVSLSASKDVYESVASYDFSTMRFKNRGYESAMQDIYFNGIKLNDANSGYGSWSLWSGLNDATRNQEVASRLNAFEYGVGGINGITNINARASQIRKGWRTSAVTANGQYRMRLMATYGSGYRDDGWSYAFSVSTRQGDNDYMDGVYYNSWAYFLAVEKELNPFNKIAFNFFGTPSERGMQMPSTQEAYDLVGHNYYNPNWGYQNGDQRNSRVRKSHEPVALLTYIYEPDEKTKLDIAASFRFGKNGYSALDWYDAPDPRPDYYKNLPSYLERKGEFGKAEELRDAWLANTNDIQQLNWNKLYNVNYNSTEEWGTYKDVNMGKGRSKYIISDRRTDQRDFNLRLNFSKLFKLSSKFYSGASFRMNRTEYYNRVKDLLGGQYWLNVDNFAERDFGNANFETLMNDVGNTSNLVAKKGDTYGHDYYAHIREAKVWGNYQFAFDNFEGFAAAELGYNSFWREGLYRKGLFPDNSLGNSEKQNFFTYTAKLGLTYKISGNQKITASLAYMNKAPYFRNAFISPRTRNDVVPNLKTEKYLSGDLSYFAKFPFMDLRISGYYTLAKDKTKLLSFYDDLQHSFTNFAMDGINQRYAGVELGFNVPIYAGLSVSGAVSYGDYIYDSNANFTQTRDNVASVIIENEKVYWDGMKIEGSPQFASSLGLNYKTEDYWFFGVDLGYYDKSYLSMNPLVRTDYAIQNLTDEEAVAMRQQEKLGSALLLNADIGKSWYINRKYNIGFSLQAKNLLNRQNIKTGGFEQLRLRKTQTDAGDKYQKFDPKYFYLYGPTYYLNIYFRF